MFLFLIKKGHTHLTVLKQHGSQTEIFCFKRLYVEVHEYRFVIVLYRIRVSWNTAISVWNWTPLRWLVWKKKYYMRKYKRKENESYCEDKKFSNFFSIIALQTDDPLKKG